MVAGAEGRKEGREGKEGRKRRRHDNFSDNLRLQFLAEEK